MAPTSADEPALSIPEVDNLTPELINVLTIKDNLLDVDDYLAGPSASAAPSTPRPKPAPQPQRAGSSSASSVDSFASTNSHAPGTPISSKNFTASSTPILISSSITAVNVTRLTELLQSPTFARLDLQAEFTYTPVADNHGVDKYQATCRIFDKITSETVQELPEADGVVWPNKKHAKEAAAKKGLDWVNRPENLGARVAAAKEKNEHDGGDGINWVGQIMEYFQQKRAGAYPTYDFYDLPRANPTPLFSCTCTFNASLLHPSLPATQTLGDPMLGFPSKKAAKTAAAKAAMLWIQSQECLKVNPEAATPPMRAGKKSTPSDRHPLAGQIITVPRDMNYRKAVSTIVAQLKYEVKYDLKADKDAAGLYTVIVDVGRRWNAKPSRAVIEKPYKGKDATKEAAAEIVMKWFLKDELKRLGVGIRAEPERAETVEGR